MSSGMQQPRLRVVDSHVTLGSTRVIPRAFVDEQAANAFHRLSAYGQPVRRSQIENRVFALYEDHDGDRLVAEMDAAGIDQAFLVAADFSHVAGCELTPPELADHHDHVMRRHPGRFKVFWGVDARAGLDGVELFEKCLARPGFVGMKLYPLAGYSPSDRRLYPYYEVCAHHRVPVLSHTGPGWGPLDFTYGPPLLVDHAARDFPSVNFILGHGGVTHVDEATYLCAHRPNVYLDISQFPTVLNADGWEAHLNTLFRTGINHKILFGTCWPSFRLSAKLDALITKFFDGDVVFQGVNVSNRKMIMSENALRLVGDGVLAGSAVVHERRR